MKIIKEIKNNKVFELASIIGMLALISYIMVGNNIISVGALVNKFSSCDDVNFLSSIFNHCYSFYDFYFCLIALGIFAISFLISIAVIGYYFIRTKIK